MNAPQTWYNAESVSQKHSVVLTNWNKERQAAKAAAVPNVKNASQFYGNNTDILNLIGGRAASSGYPVTDLTAMRVSAVSACIQLIGGTIASLPLSVYERTDDGRKKIESPLWYILNEQPCGAWTAASMFEWFVRCNGLRGDAYAKIQRNAGGVITGLVPLHPDRVQTVVSDGDIQYYYQPRNGNAYGIYSDDMLHIPGFGYDGETGRSLSVVQHAAFQAIGIALAADDFSGKFYANGASAKHVITSPGKMGPDQIDLLRQTYSDRYTGPSNIGKPMVLTEGLTVTELSMSAIDAELLDSRKYQVIDIARAFGVPPFMIGANDTTTSWGTGIEQMTLGFVKFTLQSYLNRIEQEINRKFFRTAKTFVEFNLDGLLRGDSKSESDYLRQARGGSMGSGWLTLNEVRRIKNLPPVEGGDVIFELSKGIQNAQTIPAAAA